MSKVIFLDNDGVICLRSNWGSRFKKFMNPTIDMQSIDVKLDDFDKECVAVINSIIEETDCDIVISSDWKKHGTLEELQYYYVKQGFIKAPIDVTIDLNISNYKEILDPRDLEAIRTIEIDEYLKAHQEITHNVVVDDLFLGNKNFVHIPNENIGIKDIGIKDDILSYLKK